MVSLQAFLHDRQGRFKLPPVKVAFCPSQEDPGDELLRVDKPHTAVVHLPVFVHNKQGRGPLDIEFRGQGFGIKGDPDGNHRFFHITDNRLIGIRNRIHLLAPDSPGIVKIEEQGFFFAARHCQARFIIILPPDRIGHGISPFFSYQVS